MKRTWVVMATSSLDLAQHHMRRPRRGDVAGHLVAQRLEVEARQQRLARAQHDRRDHQVQLVDQARRQVLAHGRGAAALARSSAAVTPSVTKWKLLPPSISNDSRA